MRELDDGLSNGNPVRALMKDGLPGKNIAQIGLASDHRVRIIDLTEWDPSLDSTDLSALTAARWVAECVAGFESR
jgi:arginase family enzyme